MVSNYGIAVGALAACVVKAVHFAMLNGVKLLHALVMAARHNVPVAHQYRADGDAPFALALACLVYCGFYEFVHFGSLV